MDVLAAADAMQTGLNKLEELSGERIRGTRGGRLWERSRAISMIWGDIENI